MNEQQVDSDVLLGCVDCGRNWIFSAKDRAFFRSRDLAQPKRCRACRAARRGIERAVHTGATRETYEWRTRG